MSAPSSSDHEHSDAEPDALVMANTEHGIPRPADRQPTQTLRTEGGLAMIYANRAHAHAKAAAEHPAQAVCTGGHLAVVIRNNTARGDAGQMASPTHEPIRTLTASGSQSLVVPYYTTRSLPAATEQAATPTIPTRDHLALVVPAGGCRAERAQLADREAVPTLTANESRALVLTDDDIDACRFRMFSLDEIAGAMVMHRHTTGDRYRVLGNKREQMAQYGNSVTPPAMSWLIGRLLEVIEAEVFVDLFCGAGGSSLGAELAGARLALGLNHWARAVETHATNFEHADHDCEDISSLTTAQIRRYLTHAKADILIGGPECTNHAGAKGAQRRKPQAASLFEDGPAGDAEQDRSRATMWDMVRFAEQAMLAGRTFKAIVVENVVEAFKWGADDDGGLFNAWLQAFGALGYRHELVWLNSMFAPPAPDPAPQSRDRMYVVLVRKGIPMPELRVEPPAWCPHCEKVVSGRQTWKRPGARLWGRYGAQYLYACPDCRAIVLPGAFPADYIIDRSLPAQRIGDRDPVKNCKKCGGTHGLACNTRQRIRRGLERLADEPFAIRLTHGGAPRPLTLPLVTLTQRHDPAVVIPVAGNTHERTAGNRARPAAERALDTVHGTLDRAIVVPPMGRVTPRPASSTPAPTQTTTTRAAVVEPHQTGLDRGPA